MSRNLGAFRRNPVSPCTYISTSDALQLHLECALSGALFLDISSPSAVTLNFRLVLAFQASPNTEVCIQITMLHQVSDETRTISKMRRTYIPPVLYAQARDLKSPRRYIFGFDSIARWIHTRATGLPHIFTGRPFVIYNTNMIL